MNKKIYIIPGWQETCRRKQYQKLKQALKQKGYNVILKNIDWNQKLSKQIFEIEKESILFGFSMGAILAYLIAQKYKCKLVILASMTPMRHFKGGDQENILIDVIGKEIVLDIKKHLESKIKTKKVLMYGDKENEKADVVIKNTDHQISDNYIKEILKIV